MNEHRPACAKAPQRSFLLLHGSESGLSSAQSPANGSHGNRVVLPAKAPAKAAAGEGSFLAACDEDRPGFDVLGNKAIFVWPVHG